MKADLQTHETSHTTELSLETWIFTEPDIQITFMVKAETYSPP